MVPTKQRGDSNVEEVKLAAEILHKWTDYSPSLVSGMKHPVFHVLQHALFLKWRKCKVYSVVVQLTQLGKDWSLMHHPERQCKLETWHFKGKKYLKRKTEKNASYLSADSRLSKKKQNKTNRKQADQDVFVNAFELTVNTSVGEQPNSMNLELKWVYS